MEVDVLGLLQRFRTKHFVPFLLPNGLRATATTGRMRIAQIRLAQMEGRSQYGDGRINTPFVARNIDKVLGLQEIRTCLQQGCVRFANQIRHVVVVARREAGVHGAQFLLLLFVVCAQTVEPDVVLRQTDIDIIGLVLCRALEQSLEDSSGADKSSLIIRVGCT